MWPPEWDVSGQGCGEEGVLKGVRLRDNLSRKLISVEANHLGDERKGIIILEDPTHLDVLYQKLEENIGKPLKLIGDMEISLDLPLPKRPQKQLKPRAISSKIHFSKKTNLKS